MEPRITTPRMMLRPVAEDDVDNMIALHSDPETMRFLTGGRPDDPGVVRERRYPAMIRRYECLGDHPGYWSAFELETSRYLGWFEMRPVDPDSAEALELGYRLTRRDWGKGYATEGSRALIDHAFERWPVRVVTANTMTVNRASRRVMQKSGLTFVRTFFTEFDEPAEGMDDGEVEYQVRREEWLASRRRP